MRAGDGIRIGTVGPEYIRIGTDRHRGDLKRKARIGPTQDNCAVDQLDVQILTGQTQRE